MHFGSLFLHVGGKKVSHSRIDVHTLHVHFRCKDIYEFLSLFFQRETPPRFSFVFIYNESTCTLSGARVFGARRFNTPALFNHVPHSNAGIESLPDSVLVGGATAVERRPLGLPDDSHH